MQDSRSVDDVIASYRAAGRFNPNHWFIARHRGRDVGCLLVTHHLNNDWELAYLGVIPEARGQGIGVELTVQAQRLAADTGAAQMMLAVDAENFPAVALYESVGFKRHEPHSVFSRILNSAARSQEPR
jgi:mycothiol synthase